jgi:hypothetical protein
LRAERDALAAELQIERAERLRAEERLRLFEREKLEQMREGAATREKLAAELEEARLRAMRAEARQAALDADLRLSELAVRRRGVPGADPDPGASAGEAAEPGVEIPKAPEGFEPEPTPESVLGRRFASAPSGGAARSKYSRLTRPPSTSGPSADRESVARSVPPTPASPSAADGPNDRMVRDSARAPERPVAPPTNEGDFSGGGRLRMSDVPPPRWPSQGAGPTPMRDGVGGSSIAGSPAQRASASPQTGAPFGARGGPAGASGGAAAGRPSIDRAQLEMRLAAGQEIETTERFRQFQPVAQAHIKMCDWLGRARTLEEIDALAAGELARSEIVGILTLFFERSYLVFK